MKYESKLIFLREETYLYEPTILCNEMRMEGLDDGTINNLQPFLPSNNQAANITSKNKREVKFCVLFLNEMNMFQ